jgi:hypothetical protein
MTLRKSMLAISFLVAIALSLAAGESLGQRSMLKGLKIQLDGVQAMLLADRIIEERKLKSLLARGCTTDALNAVNITENSDMKLLAEFVGANLDQPSLQYISSRSPGFLDEVKSFKSSYRVSWSEVTCAR